MTATKSCFQIPASLLIRRSCEWRGGRRRSIASPARPETLSNYYDRTIVISGLSKSMSMTGWRLGWLCGEEPVVKAALVLHGYVTTCASAVSQKASLVSWTDEDEAARAGFAERVRRR